GNFEDKVSVLLGVGDGTFNAAVSFDVGTAASGITADDLDKDLKPDIITANTDDNTLSVLLNTTPVVACVGDCDGGGVVTISELITMVNVALESQPVSACLRGDADHDGKISINEIITAVINALGTCPVG